MSNESQIKELILEGNNYSDVGKKVNLTRERIRQIAGKLGIDIKKLRANNPLKYSKVKYISGKCLMCRKNFIRKYHSNFCSNKCWNFFLKSCSSIKGCQKFRFKNIGGEIKIIYRVKMEKYLGRKLKSSEHIHHKDGNIQNNNLNNLQVLSEGEHRSLHSKIWHKKLREKVKELAAKEAKHGKGLSALRK